MVLGHDSSAAAGTVDQARAIFDGLRSGTIDRSLFTPNGGHRFSQRVLADIKFSLKRLGPANDIIRTYESPGSGLITRTDGVESRKRALHAVTRAAGDGELGQSTIAAE